MTTKPPYNPKTGYRELMKITGLGRETVKAAIRTGELPGAHIGKSYIVPEAALIAFSEGRWTPQPHPIFPQPIQAKPRMIHSRKEQSA